jgi:hypothetical protein
MRKLVLSAVVAVVAATAAAALASSQATTFSFKQSTRAEGASTGIAFKVEFGDPAAANGVPSGLKDFKITMPRGAKIDPGGATQCKTTDANLMSKGAAACPAASRIGTGKATATSTAGSTNVDVAGYVFNAKSAGKNSWLFVFLINNSYAASFYAPVKGPTLSAKGLTGAVPGDLLVTKFAGTIAKHSKGKGKKKHNLITAPSVCPKSKKWINKASWTFVDGSKDTSTSTSPCKPGR